MTCAIPAETLERLIEFHGHTCPGLAIGVRVAELARRELGEPAPPDLVAVVETDMCGVDAIQFLTSCTLGKGNLIHRDHGKMAFSFYDRSSGRAFRAMLRPESRGGLDDEIALLTKKRESGEASDADAARLTALRSELEERFMALELDEMFEVRPLETPPPRPAQILGNLVCDECGETAMESRTRRYAGRTLCLPCFARFEQKI